MTMLQIPESFIIVFITFLLGLISAAYGVQVGKSFEARKELLEKMRDWIDEVVLEINILYQQEILGKSNQTDLEKGTLFSVHKIRWVGIVDGLHSSSLSESLQLFITAKKNFDARYYALEKYSPEKVAKRKQDLVELVDQVDQAAMTVHKVVTQESAQIPFWLVRPAWKSRFFVWLGLLMVFILLALLGVAFVFHWI